MIDTGYKSNIPELLEVMQQYADLRGMELSEVMVDQANKLSCSDFGGQNVGLFQLAAKTAPDIAELVALPQKLGWRIKRKNRPVFTLYREVVRKRGKYAGQVRRVRVKRKTGEGAGKSMAKGEISIRIARRFYQAIGWLSPTLSRYERALAKEGNFMSGRSKRKAPPAQVELRLQGDQLFVIITNRSKNSAEVNRRHGDYVQVALEMRKKDMIDYINRKLSEKAKEIESAPLTPV